MLPVVVPPTVERRFLAASVPAPVAAGRVAVRVVAAGAPAVVVGVRVLPAAGRAGKVLEAVTGFLAAAVVVAIVLLTARGFPGELTAGVTAVEVRRAAVEGTRFFSSSDMEGCERCDTVEAAVGGLLVRVAPAAGLVAVGLVKPPAVLVRVLAVVVGFVAVAPCRLTAPVAVGVVRFSPAVLDEVVDLGEATVGEVASGEVGVGVEEFSC